MKTTLTLLAATAATLLSTAVVAADSGDRTSMPDACADRSANCVIQDGPPRNRRGQLVDTGDNKKQSGPNQNAGKDSKSGSSSDRNSSR
jgi:hypothetical protein